MMKSMTGYGKAETDHKGKRIVVEIKSLNNKQFDFIARIPQAYKEKELEIRNELANKLQRGKVELTITIEEPDNYKSARINQAVMKKYFREIMYASEELGVKPEEGQVLQAVLRMPDILVTDEEALDAKEWAKVFASVQKATGELIAFRIQEGMALQEDILWRVHQMQSLLEEVEAYDSHRGNRIKERLSERMKELQSAEVDENRFEQEVLYYMEKLDISEEKTRLLNHCKYFLKTADEKQAMGKKLNFIAQEINREVNTIGSKAYDSDIQRLVVQMKDELEKIKEQIMNVL